MPVTFFGTVRWTGEIKGYRDCIDGVYRYVVIIDGFGSEKIPCGERVKIVKKREVKKISEYFKRIKKMSCIPHYN